MGSQKPAKLAQFVSGLLFRGTLWSIISKGGLVISSCLRSLNIINLPKNMSLVFRIPCEYIGVWGPPKHTSINHGLRKVFGQPPPKKVFGRLGVEIDSSFEESNPTPLKPKRVPFVNIGKTTTVWKGTWHESRTPWRFSLTQIHVLLSKPMSLDLKYSRRLFAWPGFYHRNSPENHNHPVLAKNEKPK